MEIKKKINVPTGAIYTALGEKGKMLEFLTVGDYGKLQKFAKQNPTYSHNLIYKFKTLIENGN